MKKLLLLYLTCVLVLSVQAQPVRLPDVFTQCMQQVFDKSDKAKFKGQSLKGKRSGMGILAMNKGTYYIGDFSRGEISGLGMMVSPNANIDNCSDCFAYIGNWRGNKKSGKGRCYNDKGELIYDGEFENDKPTGKYPCDASDQFSFSVHALNNGTTYIGAALNGIANGFGMLAFSSGDVWMSTFKDGSLNGIGLYLQHDGEWETMNYKDGQYDVVSSSVAYKNIDEQRKRLRKAAISEAMTELLDAVQSTLTLVGDIQSMRNDNVANDACKGTGTSGSQSSDSSHSTKKGRTWVSCSTCQGTGICRNCNGTGKYSFTKDGKCHECRPVGSGKCGTCKGKKGSYVN